MWIAENWKDYEVLDTSKGEKLERWGDYTLVRKNKNTRISGRKIASAFGGSQGTVFGPYNFRLYHHQNYRFANP